MLTCLQLLFVSYYSRNQLKVSTSFQIFHFEITPSKITSSCHTLSKTIDISRKTLLASASNNSYISCGIDINWLINKFQGLKLDYLGEIKLISLKNLNNSLNIIFPIFCHKIVNVKLDVNFFSTAYQLSW